MSSSCVENVVKGLAIVVVSGMVEIHGLAAGGRLSVWILWASAIRGPLKAEKSVPNANLIVLRGWFLHDGECG
jgi:hypothetical protein